MSYLLDTSTCIAMLRDKPSVVRRRALDAASRSQSLLVSSIVLHELWYGVYNSAHIEKNEHALRGFMGGNVEMIEFDVEDARIAGEIRAELEKKGRVIGPYDTLIAAQCLRYNLVLVTTDIKDFGRVTDLRWENWAT